MARSNRRSASRTNSRAAGDNRGSRVGARPPAAQSAPPRNPRARPGGLSDDHNMMEDFAGIDEMRGNRPVSRRVRLDTDDLTNESGLTAGRQRDVPKTIRNAAPPNLDDDLGRDLPDLPNAPTAVKLAWAQQSNALESIDMQATQPMAPYRAAKPAATAKPETLPVGPPPADSGIMRVKLGASAVLGAVDYNEEMMGSTVEEARQRTQSSNGGAKPARRSRRGSKGRRATGPNKAARKQGSNIMAKASARKEAPSRRSAPEPKSGSRDSRRGAAESKSGSRASRRSAPEAKTSNRTSRRGTAVAAPDTSSRGSRRSKATRSVPKVENNTTMILGIGGGILLILIVIAAFAFGGGGDNNNSGGQHNETTIDRQSPQYWENEGDKLVRNGGDRELARTYLMKAVELYDAAGDKARADVIAQRAYGLLKDGHVNVRGQ